MAVFLINICKFNGCGITFPSLGDLIQHIEDTHIDYDPKVVEQKEQAQPACLPLSYVLRFISEDARKENSFIASTPTGVELKRKLAIKHHSYSMSSSNRSNTPTGSEMDEDEMVVTESEDSNDSWTTEEFSSEFIMRYGSRHSGTGSNGTPGNEKPFACPVPGCKKRYKNVNGIKYHSKNGHKKDGKVRKGYKCHCGKSYKTAQGLKNHAIAAHNSTTTENILTNQQHIVSAGNGILMQRSSSPSQSLGSLSPSSISNMSSSASSCHGGTGIGIGTGSVQNISSNILQHLTNGVTATITTGNIVTNANGNIAVAPTGTGMNLQIHQPPQPQFNALTNANGSASLHHHHHHQQLVPQQQQQQLQQHSSTLPISEIVSTLSGDSQFHAAPPPPPPTTTATTCTIMPSKTTTITATATTTTFADNINAISSSSSSSLNSFQKVVSTTFIEHKYSAKKYKEKFYANLRNDCNDYGKINNNNNNNNNSNNNNNNNMLPKFHSIESAAAAQTYCNTFQSSNFVEGHSSNSSSSSSMYDLNKNFKNIST